MSSRILHDVTWRVCFETWLTDERPLPRTMHTCQAAAFTASCSCAFLCHQFARPENTLLDVKLQRGQHVETRFRRSSANCFERFVRPRACLLKLLKGSTRDKHERAADPLQPSSFTLYNATCCGVPRMSMNVPHFLKQAPLKFKPPSYRAVCLSAHWTNLEILKRQTPQRMELFLTSRVDQITNRSMEELRQNWHWQRAPASFDRRYLIVNGRHILWSQNCQSPNR